MDWKEAKSFFYLNFNINQKTDWEANVKKQVWYTSRETACNNTEVYKHMFTNKINKRNHRIAVHATER